MGEYWYKRENFENQVDTFFNNPTDPAIVLDYTIGVRDFVTSGNAAAQIKLTLKKLGVDPVILRRTAIAVYEAEINMTAHAQGGELKCNVFPDCVHIVCHDFGPGIKDIEQSMVPGYSTAEDLVREMGFGAGLGLPNIKKNTDLLHIISGEGERTYLEIIIYFE